MDEEGNQSSSEQGRLNKSVLVIHGRDDKAYLALCDFLRAIDLRPLESSEVRQKLTGNPTDSEILDYALRQSQAVLVLLTPDDEVRLRVKSSNGQPVTETTWQPSPSAILKAGVALGRHPERTILLKAGNVRVPSHLQDLHPLPLDNEVECRTVLAGWLATAGCAVNLSGTDWRRAGQFVLEQTPTGILDARPKMPFDELLMWIGAAYRRVIIFQMWMTVDTESYREAFRKLSGNKDCSVRILLLRPESKLAAQRSRDMGRKAGFVRRNVRENIDFFTKLAREYELEGLEIRLFEAIAPFQLYVVDDRAFVGFYPQSSRATDELQLEVRGNGFPLESVQFGNFILSQFEAIWGAAEPLYPKKALRAPAGSGAPGRNGR